MEKSALEYKQVFDIGLISDTHGLLRPSMARALKGVGLILHAGDIDRECVLTALGEIAPVVAVRGNMDGGKWAAALPPREAVMAGGVWFYILHDLHGLDLDPRAAGFGAVVHGHTHRPAVRKENGVLFINPGSAGPARPDRPVTVARARVRDGAVTAAIIDIEAGGQ